MPTVHGQSPALPLLSLRRDIIGVTTVQEVGGRICEARRPKLKARMAESGGGVLGEGAASPSLPARGSGGAL